MRKLCATDKHRSVLELHLREMHLAGCTTTNAVLVLLHGVLTAAATTAPEIPARMRRSSRLMRRLLFGRSRCSQLRAVRG